MFAKSFRNTLIASTLLVGASILTGTAAMAGSDTTGAVTVSGTVQEFHDVNFTAESGATTNITAGAAVAAYPLGTLFIQSNLASGWKLEVTSSNGGQLLGGFSGTESIAYTALTIPAITGATITSATFTGAAQTKPLATAGAYTVEVGEGVSRAVTASIAADQYVQTGVYTDTLTFTLSAP